MNFSNRSFFPIDVQYLELQIYPDVIKLVKMTPFCSQHISCVKLTTLFTNWFQDSRLQEAEGRDPIALCT